jgi:predicted nucleotidyltransferase
MLTAKQLRIFGAFSQNAFNEVTFKQIKEFCNEKSNSLIQNAISQFLLEDLISQRTIGTSKLYRLNHENPKSHYYIGLYALESLPNEAVISLMHVKRAVERDEQFFSIAVFGSYSKKSHTKRSDLDIAVFIKDKGRKRAVELSLKSALNRSLIELDCHVIASVEFKEMLGAEYANLGKEIAANNLPVINPSIFYNLLIAHYHGRNAIL